MVTVNSASAATSSGIDHLPTASEVMPGARWAEAKTEGFAESTRAEEGWIADCALGPPTFSTRFPWPEE